MLLKPFAISLAVPFVVQASSGWNGAEWGMTPQEVEQATDGFARAARDELPREGREPVVGNRAEFESELSDFEVRYFYTSAGLHQIELTPDFDDCEDVMRDFISSFGQPKYHEQVILRTFVWEDEANDNRIVLIHSTADTCEFNFYSLSAFREREEAS